MERQSTNLLISSTPIPLLSTDISSEDEEARKRGEELLNKALDTASKINAPFLGGVLYSTLGKYRAPSTPANLDHSAAILRRLCARASDLGITIGLEPCNRYETNVINTAAETVAFIDRIGAPNAVVHLDTYHMHIEERYEDAVNACGGRAGYLHIGESHRGMLGTGNVDFGRVFKALARAGYSAPIVFESFSRDIMNAGFVEALAVWRNLWDVEDAGEVASNARVFIGRLIEMAGLQRGKERSGATEGS